MANTASGLRHATARFLKWTAIVLVVLAIALAVGGYFVVRALVEPDRDLFGSVEDEAKRAGRSHTDFRAADDPYFVSMDKGLLEEPATGADGAPAWPAEILEVAEFTGLSPEEVRQAAIRGQNTWTVWTGGNDRFWDYAAQNQLAGGAFDLLKLVSSHEAQAYGRPNRWHWLGLVNEPCFRQAEAGDPARFGLWLDRRIEDDAECGPDPFADAEEHPGVEIGARGKPIAGGGGDACTRHEPATGPTAEAGPPDRSGWPETLPVGSYYGEPTGVIGLRLFPNPDFDAEARKCWDPVRYYTDPSYYNDKDLVRPYRVGMACAFCHTGPSPVNAPERPESPRWTELASNPGAQYYWVNRVFFWNTEPRSDPAVAAPNEGNLLYQLFHTNPPGTLDTSLVSTDYMNNPRTMNAVYNVIARQKIAADYGLEQLTGADEAANKQFQDYAQTEALADFYDRQTGRVGSMRVLKDGADSVGTLGALNRVYLNIGLFSEEWLLHFRPFLGGQKISPIRILDAQKNSAYWRATEEQTADMAIFFLVTARADRLEDALRDRPDRADLIAPIDSAQVERGKVVFAETCAACHSSKQPAPPAEARIDEGVCKGGGSGPDYRECWERYWTWANSPEFKREMVRIVRDEDGDGEPFLANNFLSTERRVPLDVLGTNACTAIATNGLRGDIWDNFTSDSYKSLPPVREVTVHHPVSGGEMPFQPLGNGRGYLRPASLVSVWSSAPFLSNNSVGHAEYDYRRGAGYVYAGSRYSRPAYQAAFTAKGEARAATYGRTAPGTGDAVVPAGAGAPAGTGYTAREEGGYGGYGSRCPAANADDPYLPCIENRLKVFDDSIRKLLTPELRRADTMTEMPVPGYIYRTTAPSCYVMPANYMPDGIRRFSGILNRLAGWAITEDGGVALGPLPAGFPINALINTKILPDNDEPAGWSHAWKLAKATPTLLSAFRQLGGMCSPEELADPSTQVHAERVVRETGLIDTLVGLSKCPDYVVNRGHNFGAELSQDDKEALIAFLKHF